MMTPRRSSEYGACIPKLTTRRHRGRSQARWTVVMLRQLSQSIHKSLHGRRRRFVGGSVFHTSLRGPLSLLALQQNLISHTYILVQHIRRCAQQTVCSTQTHPYCN